MSTYIRTICSEVHAVPSKQEELVIFVQFLMMEMLIYRHDFLKHTDSIRVNMPIYNFVADDPSVNHCENTLYLI